MRYVEGKALGLSLRAEAEAKIHAIPVDRITSQYLSKSMFRPAVCGRRTVPQVLRLGRKKHLKEFTPQTENPCKRCLKFIENGWGRTI